jgi:hypothetical protein
MQLNCCGADVAPANSVAVTKTVDHGGAEAFFGAALAPVAFMPDAPSDRVATYGSLPRSGPPAWLLNSTLLN